MNLHFRDRRGAASLRHRNRAATTVLMCEQKPYPVHGIRGGAKDIRYRLNMAKPCRRIVSRQFSRSLHTLLSWSLGQAMRPVTVSTISVSRASMRLLMGGT